MKPHTFSIVSASGQKFEMVAERKSEVRERIHNWMGIPYEYIDKHMKITNMGVCKNEKKQNSLSSEDEEQIAVIEYCDIKHIPIVHIPNEGKRSIYYASKLKKMGLRAGFPDLFIPRARGKYHGLFIEMKYGDGKASGKQKDWLTELVAEGYACAIAYGAGEACRAIDQYNDMEVDK